MAAFQCAQGVEGKLTSADAGTLAAKHIVGLSRTRRRAMVVLRADAGPEDVLAAYVHGYALLHSNTPMVRPSKLRTAHLLWCNERPSQHHAAAVVRVL